MAVTSILRRIRKRLRTLLRRDSSAQEHSGFLSSQDEYLKIQLEAEKDIILDVSDWVGEEEEWEYWAEYVKDYFFILAQIPF